MSGLNNHQLYFQVLPGKRDVIEGYALRCRVLSVAEVFKDQTKKLLWKHSAGCFLEKFAKQKCRKATWCIVKQQRQTKDATIDVTVYVLLLSSV
jgi:hypothetical protein